MCRVNHCPTSGVLGLTSTCCVLPFGFVQVREEDGLTLRLRMTTLYCNRESSRQSMRDDLHVLREIKSRSLTPCLLAGAKASETNSLTTATFYVLKDLFYSITDDDGIVHIIEHLLLPFSAASVVLQFLIFHDSLHVRSHVASVCCASTQQCTCFSML